LNLSDKKGGRYAIRLGTPFYRSFGKELDELGISGAVVKIANPWYVRKKGSGSWIKIGESEDMEESFPVRWDTTALENGSYEILGLMHVSILDHETEHTIARQSIVDVTIDN